MTSSLLSRPLHRSASRESGENGAWDNSKADPVLWDFVASKSSDCKIDKGDRGANRQRARSALSKGELGRALELYQHTLNCGPIDEESISDAINLGALLRKQGHMQTAAEHYRRWLPQLRPTPIFSVNACNCLREMGASTEALKVVENCLRSHPDDSQLLISKAECLLDLKKQNASRSLLEGLLIQKPNLRKAWVVLGVVLAGQKRLEAALHAFEQADILGSDEGEMAANRINLLKDLGRLDEAEAHWKELSATKQCKLAVRGALAGLRLAQNKPEVATQLLAKLCQEQPEESSHWLNWAAGLRSLKYTVAPYKVLQRGLLHHPEEWDLQEALGQSLSEMGAENATKRLWEIQSTVQSEDEWKDVHLFNRQFVGISSGLISAEERAQQAQDWERRKCSNGVGTLWADHLLEPLKDRPLRVGYLTADSCNHPVGRFLLPILKQHNRRRIETWMLNCGNYKDWITAQLREASNHWVDLNQISDNQAARLIADLRLDVIVELGGFTGGSRIGILAQRVAPVQLSYLGYPAPTYLKCIDGWIGDSALFNGLETTDLHPHKLLKIGGGYMAFDPGDGIDLPSRQAGSRIRFGCFNHARKLSDSAICLFVKVLKAVPQAEIVLKSITFHETAERKRIKKRFEEAGLEPERLILLEWVKGGKNHLMRYSEVDVALDPIPYGGATTTCEALWMGVPVVTLAGSGMAGRLSCSILESASCNQWIAHSESEYLTIAEILASEGPRQLASRQVLREKVAGSALADAKRLAQSLEECYRKERESVRGI